MGQIPEKSSFDIDFREALAPYFKVVVHIRKGALEDFKRTLEQYKELFTKDGNFNLINRLRHNLFKFVLRKVNLSYSKISL